MEKRKQARHKKRRPPFGCRLFRPLEYVPFLKQETEADLKLPRRIGKVTVGVNYATERRVEVESSIYGLRRGIGRSATDDIPRVVHRGDVLMVENVEGLAEQLDGIPFAKAN